MRSVSRPYYQGAKKELSPSLDVGKQLILRRLMVNFYAQIMRKSRKSLMITDCYFWIIL